MRSLISILDFTAEELDRLIDTAMDIIENPEEYSQKCRGKKLATLFFEPSTRTRLSFEAAMYELGGNVIGFSEAASSSSSKGESVADTAKIISCYADIIAMRHPMEGAPLVASRNASIPVINAGDGGHNHPTQTLADILTIYREKGRLNDLTIGMCGDLKYGRTVHSLIEAMSERKGIKIVLISPDELRLPGYIKKDVMDKKGMEYEEIGSLEQALPGLDVLYMTRVQRERFDSLEEYERLKDSYILTPEKLAHADEKMAILHPLPRVNEISVAVDDVHEDGADTQASVRSREESPPGQGCGRGGNCRRRHVLQELQVHNPHGTGAEADVQGCRRRSLQVRLLRAEGRQRIISRTDREIWERKYMKTPSNYLK